MGLFRRKCEYCKRKIDRGEEIIRNVKVPGFIGTREKAFCCLEHAELYEKGVSSIKNGKSCCC